MNKCGYHKQQIKRRARLAPLREALRVPKGERAKLKQWLKERGDIRTWRHYEAP